MRSPTWLQREAAQMNTERRPVSLKPTCAKCHVTDFKSNDYIPRQSICLCLWRFIQLTDLQFQLINWVKLQQFHSNKSNSIYPSCIPHIPKFMFECESSKLLSDQLIESTVKLQNQCRCHQCRCQCLVLIPKRNARRWICFWNYHWRCHN